MVLVQEFTGIANEVGIASAATVVLVAEPSA